MNIPRNEVADLKEGDVLAYQNGARRKLERVRVLAGDKFGAFENYDPEVDGGFGCSSVIFGTANGRVVLPDDVIHIERQEEK